MMHHGTIDFVTEEGIGTTFIVTLPIVLESHPIVRIIS
ncbi:MAG: HAMP domain-containing histidine kinase [Synechococcaceae cyanobacterium RL_1_2]|nr:HAMP domain-containing histidine kinase [Synechococcaceae cyanobacterium RL_1_2]